MSKKTAKIDEETWQELFDKKNEYERLTGEKVSFDDVIRALNKTADDEKSLENLFYLKKKDKGLSEFDKLFSL